MKMIDARGARMPAIGLGTYGLNGGVATDIVARAIEIGYRHLDTARMYGNEREVGEGIRRSGIDRDSLFVTTKVWHSDIGGGALQASAQAAVDALGIGAVDLLLIHWPNASVALEESIDALNDAAERGLTAHIGVANFTSPMFDEASAASPRPLICNQVEYHPFLSQDAVIGSCARQGAALVAYSPIGQGKALLQDPTIAAVAERHGRTPAQVVLRWEIQQERVAAIPRTTNPERLRENFGVFDFELAPDEMDRIGGLGKRHERLVDPAFAPNWDRV